jgi:hypothetical protein
MGSTTTWTRRIALGAVAVGLVATSMVGCSSDDRDGSPGTTTTSPSAYPNDDALRLNQIQVVGSHNSYRQRMPPEATAVLENFIADQVRTLDYEHPPLVEQFGEQGIRQIELDVFADPAGGLYATRHAAALVNLPAEGPPEMREPGFKTFHIQEIDFATTCLTFVTCLQQVKEYSDANPDHAPIMILVEAKDDPIPDPLELGFTVPQPIGAPEFDAIDAEIRSVFGPDDLITPDDVRGSRATLEEAVLADGWPTLGQSRGKVLFGLDNASKRAEYTADHPSLAGRVMFTSAEPGEPEAAFIKRNDPVGIEAEIQDLVRKGYVVRTRADADTEQARTGDTTMREAALASGAQWVSTDYVDPDPKMGTDYSVRFANGTTVRCNPISAPPSCTAPDIERGRVSGS